MTVEQLDRTDADRILLTAQRSAAFARTAPLLIATLDQPRILWINAKAEAMFGTGDLGRLSRLLFAGAGRRAMIERLKRASAGSSAQLERLTVVVGFHIERLTVMSCTIEDGGAGPLVVMQVLDGDAGHVGADAQPEHPAAAQEPEIEPMVGGPAALNPEPEPEGATPASARSVSEVAALFAERAAQGRPPRFTWETDQASRLTAIGPALAEIVGSNALLVGDDFAARIEPLAPTAAAQIRDLLAQRRSWSGLSVEWPVAGSEAAVAVTLGGAPLPGTQAGYRGFGIVHLDRVSALPRPPASPAADPAPSDTLATVATEPTQAVADEPTPSVADAPVAPPLVAEPAASSPPRAAPVSAEAERSKVVHLMHFRAQPNGQPAWTAPPIEPPPSEEPQHPLPTAPQWSESPEPVEGETSPILSETEHSAFQEIGRTLATASSEDATGGGAVQDIALPSIGVAGAPSQDAGVLLDRLPIGILVLQRDRAVYANRMLLDLLGFASFDDLMAAGDPAKLFGGSGDGPAPAGGHAHTMTLIKQDGGSIAVDGRMQAFEWHREPATLMSFRRALDDEASARIEAIRLDLHRIQGTAQDLADALEVAASGAGVLDQTGRILAVNPAAERFFGYDQREIVGDPATLVLVRDDAAVWADFFRVAVEGSEDAASHIFTGRRRNGEQVRLDVTLKPLGDGRISVVWHEAALAGDADRTAIDTARRDAERTSSLKSEFLAKVSHEIRTPLNAIIGFAEIMMEERFGPVENDRYREYLRDIHASGTHVISLVNDLLDLSRIEAGRLDLKLVPVNANEVIGQCVATLQGQAHRERVILRLSLAPRLPQVLADERALRQIVLNLLSNAVKFNEPGGQVIVSTALNDKGAVAVRIRDTGIGMSEKDIETAMEPFRQLETPKASAGSGLGLPLTKALVEASEAAMSIRSRPGEGTLVEVVFQTAEKEALSVPAE